MRLKELQIYNRAPFKDLKISTNDSKISILSGMNGTGKTTILSYIVDAFYEFGKKGFLNSFEWISGKFYRVSSDLAIMNPQKISFVYLRFENEGKLIDYIDVRNLNEEEEYQEALQIENAMPYDEIKKKIGSNKVLKYFNVSNKEEIESFFNTNILTYFPAYRYEQPGYLNNAYAISLNFKKEVEYAGYLPNQIEVTSALPEIANWIMDIVLDCELYKNEAAKTLRQLNEIFTIILHKKANASVRLGIGPRQNGAARIQIVKRNDGTQVYPSIFSMSSGESALICLFCEIIRQADKLGKTFEDIKGIVLIDEIDKHLHITMQKDALPALIKMFPNIQFIVTSHSPFFNLGFADEPDDFYTIYDMDNEGLLCRPENNDLFEEVYQILITENMRYANKYNMLFEEVKKATTPLIITEGKTDWKHLKAAMNALNINDLKVEFYENTEPMGDDALMKALKQFAMISPNRKIIGMFDRDNENICDETSIEGSSYVKLSDNIFVFSIPVVNEEIYGKYTSIEHYYRKEQLLKEDRNGHRLFLGEEFYESGNSKDMKYQTRFKGIQNKVKVNGIIDEKVYCLQTDPELKKSIALSKDDFAQMILDEDSFANGFDFSEFQKIFEVIREIVS